MRDRFARSNVRDPGDLRSALRLWIQIQGSSREVAIVAEALVIVGAALIVTGLSFWSYQLALIVAGAILLCFGVQMGRLANRAPGEQLNE